MRIKAISEHRSSTACRWVAGVIAATFVLGSGVASADRRNPLEGQPPIRHKVEMRSKRFEIAPQFMVSTNQDFRHFLGGSLVLQFHITDWLGIGAQFAYGGSINSGLTDEITKALPIAEEGLKPSKDQFATHLGSISYLFSAYATLTPFAGKVSLFGALFLKYDFYAMLGIGGIGMTNTYKDDVGTCNDQQPPNHCKPMNDGLKFGGMFGMGAHLYFTDFVGLTVEFRDYLASTNPGGLDVNNDRRLNADDETATNNFFVSVGISILLPATAKISP